MHAAMRVHPILLDENCMNELGYAFVPKHARAKPPKARTPPTTN
jgi:hypothetical protein